MRSILHLGAFGGLAVLLAASAAQAQTPAPAVRTEKNISLALANQIAAEAVAACAANGYNVAATVVDRAGTVRAVQRADNAGPHTLASSERKAWTSASAASGGTWADTTVEAPKPSAPARTRDQIPRFITFSPAGP